MLVSVIMPMRNAAPYVLAAVNSVLQQQSVDLEILVVDDGSTDASAAIVRNIGDSRIRLVPGPQKGIAACMNVGLAEARGDVIMRCDADDLYPQGRIARQLELLQQHPSWIAVCGTFQMVDIVGRVVAQPFTNMETESVECISDELSAGNLRTSLCTFAIRREALAKMEWFRSYFETAEDLDFAYRLGALGVVGFVKENFLSYRIHSTSITHTVASRRRVFFDETARIFAQQRKAEGKDDLMRGQSPAPPPGVELPVHSADQHLLGLMVGDAWSAFKRGQIQMAIGKAIDAVWRYPFYILAWNLLLRLSVKSALRYLARSGR